MADATDDLTATAVESVRARAAAAGLALPASDLPGLARASADLRAHAEVPRGWLNPSDEPAALDLRSFLDG